MSGYLSGPPQSMILSTSIERSGLHEGFFVRGVGGNIVI